METLKIGLIFVEIQKINISCPAMTAEPHHLSWVETEGDDAEIATRKRGSQGHLCFGQAKPKI